MQCAASPHHAPTQKTPIQSLFPALVFHPPSQWHIPNIGKPNPDLNVQALQIRRESHVLHHHITPQCKKPHIQSLFPVLVASPRTFITMQKRHTYAINNFTQIKLRLFKDSFESTKTVEAYLHIRMNWDVETTRPRDSLIRRSFSVLFIA